MIEKPFDQHGFKLHLTCYEANMHLRAYKLDRNPQHIIDAYMLFRRRKLSVPLTMVNNLDRGLGEINRKPTGNPKKNTVRDLFILRSVLLRYQTERIPANVGIDMIDSLAREWKTSASAIKMVISRLRSLERNPEYDAPRAFRSK